jgi:phosphate transport system permease protein
MPTIVLGFFAIDSLTPALQGLGVIDENQIFSALSAGIVVGLLITPLISSLSEDALRAVPRSMREGAYGVGATKRVVAMRIVLPAALSGVMASIVLGISRAVGETMAVTLAAGTQARLSADPTEGMQTITAYIVAISKGEATRGSIQYESIFAVGLLLFVVTLLINIVAVRFVRRFRTVYQ